MFPMYHNLVDFFLNCRIALGNMEINIKSIRPKKKICMFQVTRNFKIGTVHRIFFYFVQNFYMGIKGKQYVRMGTSHEIL